MVRSAALAAVVTVIALLAACASAPAPAPAPSASPTKASDEYHVVVIGDSLSVDPPRHCDGCFTWISQYTANLEARMGQRVVVSNEAAAGATLNGTHDEIEGEVVEDLKTADLVLVWIGTNDGPPWPDDSPCGPVDADTKDGLLAGVEAYSDECMAETIAEYGDDYESLFADVAAASPAAEHLALTTYDEWFDSPALWASTFDRARVEAIVQKVAPTFDLWNAEQCDAAARTGFRCVDTYHLINGPDGRTPGGPLLAEDRSHLSQAGHDAVARLLASVELDPPR